MIDDATCREWGEVFNFAKEKFLPKLWIKHDRSGHTAPAMYGYCRKIFT